jgi:P4 family phage/plasmid primase-like protien
MDTGRVKEIDFTETKIIESVLSSLEKNDINKATEILCRYLESIYKIYTPRHDEKTEMYVYCKEMGIVIPCGKSYLMEETRRIVGDVYSRRLVREVLAKVEADTYVDYDSFFQTRNPHEVCLLNGIFDMQQKELRPHDRNRIFFKRLPVLYNPESRCHIWSEVLDVVLPDKESQQCLQECFGYILEDDANRRKTVVMLEGKGDNGKSLLLSGIGQVIGTENCSNISLTQIEKDKFILSELMNKMVNISADLGRTSLKDTGNFKSLSGGDIITAQRKWLPPVEFRNSAKMFFSCNELPRVYDNSTGFWNRWKLFQFKTRFVSDKEYQEASAYDQQVMKIKDSSLQDKLMQPAELSGIFNWMLQGLYRLNERGDFTYCVASESVRMRWMRGSDSFKAFITDCLEVTYGNKILKPNLRNVYAHYTLLHQLQNVGDKAIKMSFDEIGVTDGQDWSHNGLRYWDGIRFKKGFEEDGYNYPMDLGGQNDTNKHE